MWRELLFQTIMTHFGTQPPLYQSSKKSKYPLLGTLLHPRFAQRGSLLQLQLNYKDFVAFGGTNPRGLWWGSHV